MAVKREARARDQRSSDTDQEKTIVIRDRRKPNQYTTDNVIARDWLPILRVGDAFFFYSVYLSMANRETESSWGSLRTQAEYLQCGVDLIIRGNKLLEICELLYIETGNHRTTNEYYILDPPSLTPELKSRIFLRLDDIAAQETSKNWRAWVKQVRKALDKHRSLPSIWAERRAKKGGPRVNVVRPQEGVREPRAGMKDQLQEKGDCDSQPGCAWDTTSDHVSHTQGEREPQPEQEQVTRETEQVERKDLAQIVRTRCRCLGISVPVINSLLETHMPEQVVQQLDWLPFRQARDPAAMLISAIQGMWGKPAQYDRDRAQEIWTGWMAPMPTFDRDEETLLVPGTEIDACDLWTRVLEEMRMQMTRVTFDTWLGGSQVAGIDEDEICVRVRDGYAAEWLRARWLTPLQRTLSGIAGRALSIQFEV